MLYVGHGLRSPSGVAEPALIDPTMNVAARNPDHTGVTMGYWPSYDGIKPQARAAYLEWLARGRRDPNAYIGYVFLFFYGLERRTLLDIPANPSLRWELPLLRIEVQRLLDLYQSNGSFRGYATRFLDVLDLQIAESNPTQARPPALERENRNRPPISLVVEIGSFARDGEPVPAEWALAWAWFHPEIYLRTPATRCTEEFSALFKARYAAAYVDGIHVRPGEAHVGVEYYAASAGIRAASLKMNVPDVFTQAAATRKLAAIVDSVTDDLDPYSRYLGRNPDGRTSLAAAALLPAELAGQPGHEAAKLRDWAAGLAEARRMTTGAELMSRWPVASAEWMAKTETVGLTQLLGRYGLGIEPDPRLGGPVITPTTPIVVFKTGPQPPQSSTPAYAAATTLLHLATAVSAADGHVSEDEQAHLVAHLESSLELTSGERARLEAHMRWLVVNGVKLTGLKRRVGVLSTNQRRAIGDLLVTVAAADGVISPEEVISLTKIFRLLNLDASEVHSQLHAHLTRARPAPARAPVTVRPSAAPDIGFPIARPTSGEAFDSQPAPAPVFALDLASIEAKFAETAAVSTLLADIFSEDDPDTPVAARTPITPANQSTAARTQRGEPSRDDVHRNGGVRKPAMTPSIAGLDGAHSALLLALVDRATWSRAEFEDLAARWQLMPDGALDRINEAALDASDEPLLEEDDSDTLTVNDYARQDLFS